MREKRSHSKYAPIMSNSEHAEEHKTYTFKPAPPVEWRCTDRYTNYLLKLYFKGWK